MLKKYLFILAILIIPLNAYTQIRHGLDFNFNAPLGISIMMPHSGKSEYKVEKNTINFQGGAGIGIGYYLGINDLVKISFLGTMRYSYDKININKPDFNLKYIYESHNISLGIMPKIYIDNFSLGLDIGAKFPLNKPAISVDDGKIHNSYNSSGTPRTYFKFVADYNIFFREDMAIAIGMYIGYDRGLMIKNRKGFAKNERYGNLNLGLHLAYRYASFF
ncbi:hypothetical protein [Brachyspira sp.]|uniref:hypothetical protein n=1 Tax=Brachyspira sp. TaxID=1977261 RepID=UPI002623F2A3|nr:hypothetical protein [Brachyspira sp.]